MIKNKNTNKLLNILFQSKIIYGNSLKKTNKEIFPFIYGIRHNYSIINIKTLSFFLKRIFKLIKLILKNNKKILLIGNSEDIQFLINKQFTKNNKNLIFFNSEWINGFITNPIVNINRNKQFTKIFQNNEIELIFIIKSNITEKYLINELISLKTPIISILNTTNSIKNINYPILSTSQNIKSLYNLMYLFRKLF